MRFNFEIFVMMKMGHFIDDAPVLACSEFDRSKKRKGFFESGPIMPRSKHSSPVRSQFCINFRLGKCDRGENCRYNHSMTEFRSSALDIVANKRNLYEDNQINAVDVFSRRVCYWFSTKRECPYGNRCRFLHRCDRMYKGDESLDRITVCGGNNTSRTEEYRRLDASDGDYNRVTSYKTRLCRRWEMFGSCHYGVKCSYAHGGRELVRHYDIPKLKVVSAPSSAALCGVASKSHDKLRGKEQCYMNWSVEKVGRIYADWISGS